jgi:predicted CXXCH cytochrome family protein
MRVCLRRSRRTATPDRCPRLPRALRLIVPVLIFFFILPFARAASAQTEAREEIDTCLTCHADESLTITFGDGATQSLAVDGSMFARSVHGETLRCTDCHAGMDEVPHPERTFKNRAEFRAAFRDACRSCHFETYTQSLDGVHDRLLAKGDARAPACADCHGAHDITEAGKPRAAISRTCARCHESISATYANSVHGRSLLDAGNPDVPVCTDCHHAHDIADPRATSWLLRTPELCGRCHTNAPLMAKYGLSPNVLSTYLADFHGASASLSAGSGTEPEKGRVTALCIDCHGVHNVMRVTDPDSPVLTANLQRTCARWHPGAPASMPAAWLSHYEPSWQKAPVVYSVKVAYAVLIPFIIGGLVLQILLHLWRQVVNR